MPSPVAPPIMPIIPPAPNAKFRIGECEPLSWMVSILFTDDFWQRDDLTRAKLGLFGFGEPNSTVKAKYENWDSLYAAVDTWVLSDAQASACLSKAKVAIMQGDLTYYSPDADEWGEKPYYEPERDIDAYLFLLWAQRNGYVISQDIKDAAHTVIYIATMRKSAGEQQEHAYPPITKEDFERLKKHPLWKVGAAILYVMGRRSRTEKDEVKYTGQKRLFLRMLQYVIDANKTNDLQIVDYDKSPTLDVLKKPIDIYMLDARVKPDDFINWAKTLPAELPMLENSLTVITSAVPQANTPEMQLMFAAMEHFWKGYGSTSSAPLKKIVTAWLQENAPRFGIDLSDNLADAIDTIMRPANARRGGLKATKG